MIDVLPRIRNRGLAGPLTRSRVDLLNAGTFTRAGTAYLFDRATQKMTGLGTDLRRTRESLVCSASDWTLKADWDIEGGGSVTLVPVMWDDDYLYGYKSTDASLLYRCDATAGTCVLVEDHASLTFGRGFHVTLATGSKRLIVQMSNGTLRYSDDHWATASACTLSGASAIAAAPFGGENGRAQDGATVCFGTYGNVGLANEIWQSADYGATWTRRLQLSIGTITHFHTMAYQAGKWICDTGDGAGKQFSYISTDGGVTWANYSGSNPSNTRQMVANVAIGDGLFALGSDDIVQVGKYDQDTFKIGHVATVQFRNKEYPMYFFCLNRVGGIWYAAMHSNNTSSGNRDQGIWVADDLDGPWALYARTPDHTVKGFWRYMGVHGGRLWYHHFDGSDVARFGSVAPARLRRQRGVILHPTRTNVIPATTADCTNASGWATPGSGTKTALTGSDALLTQSLRYTRPVSAGSSALSNITPGLTSVPASTNYVIKAWVRSLQTRDFVLGWTGGGSPPSVNVAPPPLGEWGLIQAVLSSGTGGTMFPYVSANKHEGYDTIIWDLGAFEMYAIGSVGETDQWGVGGGATPADALSIARTLASDWTALITLQTFPFMGAMAAATVYPLFTLAAGSGEYIQVWYDTTDEKLYVETVDASTPSGSPLGSAAVYLTREHPLRVGLRYSAGVLRASIVHPRGGVEHLTGVLERSGDPLTGACNLIAGADDGTVTLPMLLQGVDVYDGAMSDDALEALIEAA